MAVVAIADDGIAVGMTLERVDAVFVDLGSDRRAGRFRSSDDGGVLVVGASATGLQLAEEIHRSGRPVTVSVGEHVRMPRVYRDEDIFTWMARVGLLDERWDEVDDVPF